MQSERSYTPPEATLVDYRRMCKALGIERSVLVRPSIYGTDLSSLVDTPKPAATGCAASR